jgi:hypothetical protein
MNTKPVVVLRNFEEQHIVWEAIQVRRPPQGEKVARCKALTLSGF